MFAEWAAMPLGPEAASRSSQGCCSSWTLTKSKPAALPRPAGGSEVLRSHCQAEGETARHRDEALLDNHDAARATCPLLLSHVSGSMCSWSRLQLRLTPRLVFAERTV